MTPLHLAAVRGNVHTVRALIAKGADVTLKNNEGQLPLYSALLCAHRDGDSSRRETVFNELLALAPQSIDHPDNNKDTVIHSMATFGFNKLLQAALQQNPERAFYQNEDFCFPIHVAILNVQPEAARLLLNITGVANQTDREGQAALHYAAVYAQSKEADAIITYCLDATPDINLRDKNGKTAFILAAESGNYQAMKALIARGADTSLTDLRGYTALHCAVQAQNDELVDWLKRYASLDPQRLDGLDAVRESVQRGRYTL